MTISTRNIQLGLPTVRPARASGWFVAAIAVHLMLTGVASAATSCSETIERTRMTRLSHCVAQAIRELVDQNAELPRVCGLDRALEPIVSMIEMVYQCRTRAELLGEWLLNLPPPAKT